MNFIFRIVADSLDWVASVTGFSYNEINIIAYYLILPFFYVVLWCWLTASSRSTS